MEAAARSSNPEHMTTIRPRWSFTGCGLLGGYYLGVWHALSRPSVPSALFDASASSFSGASAGALVSTAIASGCSHDATTSAFERIAEHVRAAGLLRCDLLALVRAEAEALLPEDAHERSRGRLSVLATDCSGAPPFLRPALLESFDSRAALVDAVLVRSSAENVGRPASATAIPTPFPLSFPPPPSPPFLPLNLLPWSFGEPWTFGLPGPSAQPGSSAQCPQVS